MTKDQLFLQTLADLDSKLISGDEYSLLRATALLRQLLLDGNNLVSEVNRTRKVKIRYEICGREYRERIFADKPVFYSALGGIHKSGPFGVRAESLPLDAFLREPVLIVRDNQLTIGDLIRYAAHVAGGVHSGVPKSDEEKLLANFKSVIAHGQPVQIYQLSSVIRVVLDALAPLREAVRQAATT